MYPQAGAANNQSDPQKSFFYLNKWLITRLWRAHPGPAVQPTSCSESVPDCFASLPFPAVPPFFRPLPGFRPLYQRGERGCRCERETLVLPQTRHGCPFHLTHKTVAKLEVPLPPPHTEMEVPMSRQPSIH